jgi:hypothetical protein
MDAICPLRLRNTSAMISACDEMMHITVSRKIK